MARLPGLDRIGYLVARRFPNAEELPPMAAKYSAGYKPTSRAEKLEAAAYRKSLEALSPEALDDLYREARDKTIAKSAEPESNLTGLRGVFAHWARMDTWTIDEITALSLGCDPSERSAPEGPGSGSEQSAHPERARRHQLILRAMESGTLALKTPPAEFIHWAKKRAVELPPDLIECVRLYSKPFTPLDAVVERMQISNRKFEFENSLGLTQLRSSLTARTEGAAIDGRIAELRQALRDRDGEIARLQSKLASRPAPADLSTRERDTCRKLIIGMAVKGYGFDPKALRSSTSKEIASDIHNLGLAIDEDTVRKWLHSSADLLDREKLD